MSREDLEAEVRWSRAQAVEHLDILRGALVRRRWPALRPGAVAMLLFWHSRPGLFATRLELDEAIPRRDHVGERDPKVVDVYLSELRRFLGRDVAETIRGQGWRLSEAAAEAVREAIAVAAGSNDA